MKKLSTLLIAFLVFTQICNSQILFQQDFAGEVLPENWENVSNNSTDCVWEFNNPKDRTFNSSTSSNGFAIIDSDNYGSREEQDADLITPEIDFSANTTVYLSFEHYYRHHNTSKAELFYSINGGTDWTLLKEYTLNTDNAVKENIDVSDILGGQASVKLKWNYIGHFGYYWCVDDVKFYTPSNMEATATTNENAGDDYVIQALENAPMIRVAVSTEGILNSVSLTELKGNIGNSTNISDISKIKLYKSGTSTNFSDAVFVKELETITANFTFDCSAELVEGNNYFWVCYSIKAEATEANVVDVAVTEVTAGGTTLNPETTNPEGTKEIKGAMIGDFVIGTSEDANYATITEAYEAVKDLGIKGNVNFSIENGTYEGKIELAEINGTDENKMITFKSQSGNMNDVIISYAAGYVKKPVIDFVGADYFRFENLTIKTTSTSFGNLVHLQSGACHNKFKKVRFIGLDVTASTYNNDKHLIYSPSSSLNDEYNSFENCVFENGYMALSLSGIGYQKPNEKGLEILSCTFLNQYRKSLFLTYQENFDISGNVFMNSNDRKGGFQSIDCFRVFGGSKIENNTFDLQFATKNVTGIELRPGTGTEDKHIQIANNLIHIKAPEASYGIILSDETNYVDVVHNTCFMHGVAVLSSAMFLEDAIQNVKVQNNLLVNKAGGYIFRYKNQTTLDGVNTDYNVIQSSSSKIARLGTDTYTFEEWQTTTTKDKNSKTAEVTFLAAEDLHVEDAKQIKIENPIATVTKDFDGEDRSTTKPCAGADEIPPVEKAVATFEDLTLEANSFWNGGTRKDETTNTYQTGSYEFVNYYNSGYSSWSGFAYSNRTDISVSGFDAQYTAIATKGVEESTNYGVSYIGSKETAVKVLHNEELDTINGLYVTNNVFAYKSMQTGDAYAKKFGGTTGNDPDWFCLSAIGYNAEGEKTDSLSFYLADFRSDDNTKDYILDEWKWFNLKPLGKVQKVVFKLSSSDNGEFGMNTPAYFCFDNLGDETPDYAPIIKTQIEPIVVLQNAANQVIDLTNAFTDIDNEDSEITLAVKSNNNESLVTTTLENKNLTLAFTENSNGGSEIVIEATSNGKIVEMTIVVTVGDDIAPVIQNQVEAITVRENAANKEIDLANAFSDADNNNDDITIAVKSNSKETLLAATVANKKLTLDFLENQHGEAQIVIQATSNGKTVDMTIAVTVTEDLAPIIQNQVAEITVKENAENKEIDLTNTFSDADDDNAEIALAIKSNSNEALLSTNLTNKKLTFDFVENKHGESQIVIEATSNGKKVEMTIAVKVEEDLAPVVQNQVEAITVNMNAENKEIDLSNAFTDVDDEDDEIAISIKSNNNEALLSAIITNKKLTLDFTENKFGTAEIIIEAISNSKKVEMIIAITVKDNSSTDDINQIITTVYPNPTKDFVNIISSEKIENIVILDMTGKVISNKNISSKETKFDISTLEQGTYILKISTNLKTKTQLLIKQ